MGCHLETKGKWTLVGSIFGCLAILAVCIAVLLPSLVEDMLEAGLKDMLVLTPEAQQTANDGYLTWVDTAGEMGNHKSVNIWMFNVTNPEEVLRGAKPDLMELGPYVYEQHKTRFNISFQSSVFQQKQIKFKTYKYYTFDRAATPAHLDPDLDNITSPNIPMQALKGTLLEDTPAQFWLLYSLVPEINLLYARRTVSELLWGYIDPQMLAASLVADLDPFYPGLLGNHTSMEHAANDTRFDVMFTGEDDLSLFRHLAEWQEMDYLEAPVSLLDEELTAPVWGTPAANRVFGSDGDYMPPGVTEESSLQIFVEDIWRVITVEFTEHVTTKGIDLLRFRIPEWAFQNSSTAEFSKPYYMEVAGLMNLTIARSKINVFTCKPHLLNCDAPIMVDGMHPDPHLHDTFLDVEPVTGATMRGAQRLQVNVLVHDFNVTRPIGEPVHWLADVQKGRVGSMDGFVHPALWIEITGAVPDDLASSFKSQVYFARDAALYSKWVAFGFALAFMLTTIVALVCVHKARKPEDRNALLEDNQNKEQFGTFTDSIDLSQK